MILNGYVSRCCIVRFFLLCTLSLSCGLKGCRTAWCSLFSFNLQSFFSGMTWAIAEYRHVLEGFCAQYRAADRAGREVIITSIIQELQDVEAQMAGYKKPLPEGLRKVILHCPNFLYAD